MNGSGVVSVRDARAPSHDAPTRTLGVTIATYATCTSFEPGIDRQHDFRVETKMTERRLLPGCCVDDGDDVARCTSTTGSCAPPNVSRTIRDLFVFGKRALRRGRPKLINEITHRKFQTGQEMASSINHQQLLYIIKKEKNNFITKS